MKHVFFPAYYTCTRYFVCKQIAYNQYLFKRVALGILRQVLESTGSFSPSKLVVPGPG